MNSLMQKMQVQRTGSDKEILFTRFFAAPRPLVYRVFTQAEHLAKWFGPQVFTNPVCEVDLRPGGIFRITMRGPDGTDYPLSGRYIEIEENRRLVMSCSTGGHPPEWHEHLRNLSQGIADEAQPVGQDLIWIVTFEDHVEAHEAGTRLSFLSRFASAADLEAHVKMGMADGWAESLEKFEALLATL